MQKYHEYNLPRYLSISKRCSILSTYVHRWRIDDRYIRKEKDVCSANITVKIFKDTRPIQEMRGVDSLALQLFINLLEYVFKGSTRKIFDTDEEHLWNIGLADKIVIASNNTEELEEMLELHKIVYKMGLKMASTNKKMSNMGGARPMQIEATHVETVSEYIWLRQKLTFQETEAQEINIGNP